MRSGNQSFRLQYIRQKKEDGFARCVLSTVRGLNSERQSLLNYMSTQLELFERMKILRNTFTLRKSKEKLERF